MRLITFALFFYALLLGSVIAAPVELSPRAKPKIGSVVFAKPKDLDPIPLAGKGTKVPHPAIVVGHGPDDSDEIHVAQVSHTDIPPSAKVEDIAPSSGLTGFLHLGQPSRVSASSVKVDSNGRTASDDEVKNIASATSANAKDVSGDVADAVSRAKALAGSIF